jgi:hypothetical protein
MEESREKKSEIVNSENVRSKIDKRLFEIYHDIRFTFYDLRKSTLNFEH